MKHILIIPVYNDWRSLNKLILNLDKSLFLDKKIKNEIFIVNDNSTEKVKLKLKNLKLIKKIKIIFLKKNLGSQKAIAVALNHLKKIKDDFIVTVMDGDGEDDPIQVKKMLRIAIKNPKHVVTFNRLKREEPIILLILYKVHLLLTFLFTLKWVSFGNFSTFNKSNISKILSNNSSWYAYSSSVLKNCKIIRFYSRRKKRYFDKSKLGLISLIEHSLRVNVVFHKTILFTSLIYLIIISIFLNGNAQLILSLLVCLFNIFALITKLKHFNNNFSNLKKYVKKVTLI